MKNDKKESLISQLSTYKKNVEASEIDADAKTELVSEIDRLEKEIGKAIVKKDEEKLIDTAVSDLSNKLTDLNISIELPPAPTKPDTTEEMEEKECLRVCNHGSNAEIQTGVGKITTDENGFVKESLDQAQIAALLAIPGKEFELSKKSNFVKSATEKNEAVKEVEQNKKPKKVYEKGSVKFLYGSNETVHTSEGNFTLDENGVITEQLSDKQKKSLLKIPDFVSL